MVLWESQTREIDATMYLFEWQGVRIAWLMRSPCRWDQHINHRSPEVNSGVATGACIACRINVAMHTSGRGLLV